MTLVPDNTGTTANTVVDGRSRPKVHGSNDKSMRVKRHEGLSAKEFALPGGVLLSMLLRRANERGHNLKKMAAELNVTYSYIAQLRSGARKTIDIGEDVIKACMLYLGMPRLTVLLASGRMKPEDFYSDPFEVVSTLPRAIEFILDDPKYGPLMTIDLIDGNPKLQYLIVALYEDATQKTLLPGRMSALQIADQIQRCQESRETLIAQTKEERQRIAANTSDVGE